MTADDAIDRARELLGERVKHLGTPTARRKRRPIGGRRDRPTWSVMFEIVLPPGQVISPGEIIVEVDDESGIAREVALF